MFLEETFSNFSRKVYRAMWRGKAYKPELRAPLIWKMNHKMKIIREHQCHTVVYVCVWLCAHECMCLCFRVRMVNAALIPTHRSCSALGVGIFFFFWENKKKGNIYISFSFSKMKQFTDAEFFFRNSSNASFKYPLSWAYIMNTCNHWMVLCEGFANSMWKSRSRVPIWGHALSWVWWDRFWPLLSYFMGPVPLLWSS